MSPLTPNNLPIGTVEDFSPKSKNSSYKKMGTKSYDPSPRSLAQDAINEINYGVVELIGLRMNMNEEMEKALEPMAEQEEEFEDSPTGSHRYLVIDTARAFNIRKQLVEKIPSDILTHMTHTTV
jgi:hypothetical protein